MSRPEVICGAMEIVASGNAGLKSERGSPVGKIKMFKESVRVSLFHCCGKVKMLSGLVGIDISISEISQILNFMGPVAAQLSKSLMRSSSSP